MHLNFLMSDLWESYGLRHIWSTLYGIFCLFINIELNVHSKKYKNKLLFWAKESVLLKNKFDVYKFWIKKK